MTEALHALASQGAIDTARGAVTVADLDRLGTFACPCDELLDRLDREFSRPHRRA